MIPTVVAEELPYAEALEEVLPELDAMLDTFDAVAGRVPGRRA